MMRAGVNSSSRDNEGRTALHVAIMNREYHGTVTLIEAGADIFAMDSNGHTPVDILLEAELEFLVSVLNSRIINLQDNHGNTLLHQAVIKGVENSYIEFFIEKGADKTIRNANGETPYHLAVDSGNEALQELLL